MAELFPARVACSLARISPRKLDYWVTSEVIAPHSVYRGPEQRRDFFLFSFTELVQLRIVASLRRTGVSLQRIRDAVRRLIANEGPAWQSGWLISDGKDVLVVHEHQIVETLTGPRQGQLAFAIVALSTAHEDVRSRLMKMDSARFEPTRYRGQVVPFARLGA